MDQSLTSAAGLALQDRFHRMIERSRAEPAPTLEQRLDRLARLRALLKDNEQRFERAISADFGHRCTIETTIAETLGLLGDIKHTAKHLKRWMAPRKVATQLQFLPGKNRLIYLFGHLIAVHDAMLPLLVPPLDPAPDPTLEPGRIASPQLAPVVWLFCEGRLKKY